MHHGVPRYIILFHSKRTILIASHTIRAQWNPASWRHQLGFSGPKSWTKQAIGLTQQIHLKILCLPYLLSLAPVASLQDSRVSSMSDLWPQLFHFSKLCSFFLATVTQAPPVVSIWTNALLDVELRNYVRN